MFSRIRDNFHSLLCEPVNYMLPLKIDVYGRFHRIGNNNVKKVQHLTAVNVIDIA